MGFFSKKSKDTSNDESSADTGSDKESEKSGKKADEGFKQELKKSRPWFDRAEQVAGSNFDYAIDCFCHGLLFEPDNIEQYEALWEVAIRRLVDSGKPAGLKERMAGGKTMVEKLVNTTKVWSKDPRNMNTALAVMEKAADFNTKDDNVDLNQFIVWIGEKVVEANVGKKQSKNIFLRAMELFESVEAYTPAVDACKRAIQMTPEDGELLSKMKDLDALRAMEKANLGTGADFRDSIKDKDAQEDIQDELAVNKSDEQHDRIIARAREAFEELPQDDDLRLKLVKTLIEKGSEDSEEEAIDLLQQAYDTTQQYRFKVDLSKIKIKQMVRQIRMITEVLEQAPGDESLTKEVASLKKQLLEYETSEYAERCEHYPTDMDVRFQYGRRLLMGKDYEGAVESFQDAQSDAKLRVPSKEALAICYVAMDWIEPAMDTLEEAVELHPVPHDKRGMSLRYLLMDARERFAKSTRSLATAQKAATVASELLQVSIKYRDIRERVEKLKALVLELQAEQDDAA
jgi:tetratricopeptide (TPR) repeat protein